MWFKSHLFNRKQYCRVGGFDSDIGSVYFCVPQGSWLGPLLFLTYSNNCSKVAKAYTVSMYADDTSLALQSQDISPITEIINDDLKCLYS